jgi:hypothetical protein
LFGAWGPDDRPLDPGDPVPRCLLGILDGAGRRRRRVLDPRRRLLGQRARAPPARAHGRQHPSGRAETWYDGIDADCAGDDDFDADKDGYVPSGEGGRGTFGVDGSGGLPKATAGTTPTRNRSEPLNGFDPLEAADVHPEIDDVWYDGLDQDCDGGDDFDQDGDGFDSAWYDGPTESPATIASTRPTTRS